MCMQRMLADGGEFNELDGSRVQNCPHRRRAPPSLRTMAQEHTSEPSHLPFSLSYSLSDFDFPRGLHAAFDAAPRGSFGRVLVGRRKEDGADVAVKIVTCPDGFNDESKMLLLIRNRVDFVFELEARPRGLELVTLPDRGARHVAYAYGTGRVEVSDLPGVVTPGEASYLIVVEPLSETLSSYLCKPQAMSDLVRIAQDISRALAFMAHYEVVHSDIKPENIMLRPDGSAVVCDFGLGRLSAPRTLAELAGDDRGTLAYKAPELHSGDGPTTLASDIYAYGLVLWCIFAGRSHAWSSKDGDVPSSRTLSHQLLRDPDARPDLSAIRPDAPAALRDIISRCLDKDPTKRPSALNLAMEMETPLIAGTAEEAALWRDLRSSFVSQTTHDNDRRVEIAASRAMAKVDELRRNGVRFCRLRPSDCIHTVAPKGAVWEAASVGNIIDLVLALRAGGSTEEMGQHGTPIKKSADISAEFAMRVEAHRQHREKGTEISAISIAAKNGHLPAVHVLIAAGADVTSGNKFSIQPLHWAAEFGHASVVYLLLSCLVDPNAREKMYGRSPLMLASMFGNESVVRVLLNDRRVDFLLKDRARLTARSRAAESYWLDNSAILSMLEQASYRTACLADSASVATPHAAAPEPKPVASAAPAEV